jgi:hypothetical protein
MPARFIFLLILGCSFYNLLQAQSPASSKIFQTGRNSDGKPIVTIRLQASGDNEDQLTSEYVFASEKGFLGPSSNPTDQSGFANNENTVFGVSYEPVTKAGAAKLLRAPWAERAGVFAHRKDRWAPRLLTDRRFFNRSQADPQFQRPGCRGWHSDLALTGWLSFPVSSF